VAPKVAGSSPVGHRPKEGPWGRAEGSHIVCLGRVPAASLYDR
jgi:hypothetical protein